MLATFYLWVVLAPLFRCAPVNSVAAITAPAAPVTFRCSHWLSGHDKYLNNGTIATCITAGEVMPQNHCLHAGHFFLGVTDSGRLVHGIQRGPAPVIWSSPTKSDFGYRGAYELAMQKKGLAVVRESSTPRKTVWDARKRGDAFCVDDAGGVEVLKGGKKVWEVPGVDCGARIGVRKVKEGVDAICMRRGAVLQACQGLAIGSYIFQFKSAGLMALSKISGKSTVVLWDTHSIVKSAGQYLIYQTDGNVVIYNDHALALWSSRSAGKQSTDLCLTSKGKVILYNGQTRIELLEPNKTASSITSSLSTMQTSTWTSTSTSRTSSATAAAPTQSLSAFQEQVLILHNQFRAKHNISALVYNATVESYALSHANTLADDHCTLQIGDRANDTLGQNLAYYRNSAPFTTHFEMYTDLWEKSAIDPPSVDNTTATQMLWRGTSAVGCAVARGTVGGDLCEVAVCDYWPAGNIAQRTWWEG